MPNEKDILGADRNHMPRQFSRKDDISMKNRDEYLRRLLAFKDKPMIKVITGMRRCGKSSLLDLYAQELIRSGVDREHILRMNFESMQFDAITEYRALYNHLEPRLSGTSRKYLLMDEIQQVKGWEKAVNSMTIDFDVDICITGSNAWLLSSELATLISGRYVEIPMLPLSFKEYLDFNNLTGESSLDEPFQQYLRYGALPAVTTLDGNEEMITAYLSGIYSTILLKDIISRNAIQDVSLLENVVRFLLHNIGSEISPNKISGFLTSAGRKTSNETVDNYLVMLEKAYLIHKVRRFDVKGKQYLKTQAKYYVCDMGLRNAVLGRWDADMGHALENIVYLELLRRYQEVVVGKTPNREVDFVATNSEGITYYQVTQTLADEQVLARELASLEQIQDNHEKVILSMDRTYIPSRNGIKFRNILDFLLQP